MNALSVPRLFMGPLPILAAGSASTSAAFRSAGSEAARADVPLPIDGTFSVNFTSTPTAPGIFSVVARVSATQRMRVTCFLQSGRRSISTTGPCRGPSP